MTEILGIISGILKFWDEVSFFVKLLQKTDEQKHQDLMVKIQEEADKINKTGRPTWD
jgi:hypothetical protein